MPSRQRCGCTRGCVQSAVAAWGRLCQQHRPRHAHACMHAASLRARVGWLSASHGTRDLSRPRHEPRRHTQRCTSPLTFDASTHAGTRRRAHHRRGAFRGGGQNRGGCSVRRCSTPGGRIRGRTARFLRQIKSRDRQVDLLAAVHHRCIRGLREPESWEKQLSFS